jgi:hypothetical protein
MLIAAPVGVTWIPRSTNPGLGIGRRDSEMVNLTTVDRESERLNLTIGEIKADVTGIETPSPMEALKNSSWIGHFFHPQFAMEVNYFMFPKRNMQLNPTCITVKGFFVSHGLLTGLSQK